MLTGLPLLVKRIFQKRTVTIVLFHDLVPEQAEQVYAFYDTEYTLIDLATYLRARKTGSLKDLPDYSVVITFDDGKQGNYGLLDVFRHYKVCPTIFMATGFTNADPAYLSETEIREMSAFVDFQSHTVSHVDLNQCDIVTALTELEESRHALERILEKEVKVFAYPYGRYSSSHLDLLEKAGYDFALTVDLGFNDCSGNDFLLKRICLSDNPSRLELQVKSTGIWEFFKKRMKPGYRKQRQYEPGSKGGS